MKDKSLQFAIPKVGMRAEHAVPGAPGPCRACSHVTRHSHQAVLFPRWDSPEPMGGAIPFLRGLS